MSFNDKEVGDDAVADPVDIPADAHVEDNNGKEFNNNDPNVDLNIPGLDLADIAGVDSQEIEDDVAEVAGDQADLNQQMEGQHRPRNNEYHLCPRRPCDYRLQPFACNLRAYMNVSIINEKGIELFGSEGEDAVL
jgi:hypothetical protein